jgi:hypothetical protein
MVKARRSHNPFKRFQEFMERILVDPFTRGRLEPAKLARKLEQAMEDNLFLEAGDRRLAPNEYDIYLSTADHQRFSPGQQTLIQDLQNRLISLARKQDYILNKKPVLRLHGDPGLRLGEIHIDANLTDTDQAGGTKIIHPEEMAQLLGKPLPGQPSGPGTGAPSTPNQSIGPTMPPVPPIATTPSVQKAWLNVRLPNADKQVYQIDKPVVKIGRQLDNDIIVQDKRVSRHHAQIDYQAQSGQFILTDLGSTNHTMINGKPMQKDQRYALRTGDHFVIGNYDFEFRRW